MLGVIGSFDSSSEDEIIAGAFALDVHPPGGQPHEWIEPMESAREMSYQDYREIATFDVGELVEKDGS
jgi:hypothetical protein